MMPYYLFEKDVRGSNCALMSERTNRPLMFISDLRHARAFATEADAYQCAKDYDLVHCTIVKFEE
jgi:hypothetical protein